MAIGGIQLYNEEGKTINPISEANAIDCTASGKQSTVHQDIADLYTQIAGLKGDDDTISNIIIEVMYKPSISRLEVDVIDPDGWGNYFTPPSQDFPYTWKRTKLSYTGADEKDANITYEIVAAADTTQTIYRTVSDNTQPIISYVVNEQTGREDPHKYDTVLPEFWSLSPVGISAQAPNAFMSSRTRQANGDWTTFSPPIQYGRWAYDSSVVFKFQRTDTNQKPSVDKALINPGEDWKDAITEAKKGYIWMITATAVGNQLQTYNNIVWNGPTLISYTL